ncbi:hypothetical protein [Providencia huashanensis]|uniref:hypothetical protein n=1 Tax=Providencia huashanensis TaxID=3037798 RepID=UPI002AFEE00F|nr:hypothetical protein [Providencia sp. 23021821]
MKTFAELKAVIDYPQSDTMLIAFLTELSTRGILTMTPEDIQDDSLTPSLFDQVVSIYGIAE